MAPAPTGLTIVVGTTPVTPVPVPALAATVKVLLVDGACLLEGWALLGGVAAATVRLYDGSGPAAPLVGATTLAASGSAVQLTSGAGVACKEGLAIEASAATLASVVWAIPL